MQLGGRYQSISGVCWQGCVGMARAHIGCCDEAISTRLIGMYIVAGTDNEWKYLC